MTDLDHQLNFFSIFTSKQKVHTHYYLIILRFSYPVTGADCQSADSQLAITDDWSKIQIHTPIWLAHTVIGCQIAGSELEQTISG